MALMLLCFYGGLGAQQVPPETRNLAWAQSFLRTLYPDIRNHRYVMTVTTSQPFDVPVRPMGNVNIQIGDFAPGTVLGGIMVTNGIVGQPPPKIHEAVPIEPKQFVTASLTFDNVGHLYTFGAEGPAIGNQEEYDRVKKLVESHPEWTDAQDVAALMKAGARYGAEEKEKLLRAIPLNDLEKLFGKMTVVSAEFETVTDHEHPLPLLDWTVIVKVNFTDGRETTYRQSFEPFKGALIEMDAVPSQVK